MREEEELSPEKVKKLKGFAVDQQRFPLTVHLEGRLCVEWTEAEDPGPLVMVLDRNMRIKEARGMEKAS